MPYLGIILLRMFEGFVTVITAAIFLLPYPWFDSYPVFGGIILFYANCKAHLFFFFSYFAFLGLIF